MALPPAPSFALTGQRVLIVGASGRGTGAHVAAMAQARGAEVVLAARSDAGLRAAGELVRRPAETVVLDMLDADGVERVVGGLGELDHVAVTADPGRPGPFLTQPLAEARGKMDKFWGAFHVARAAAPRLRDGGSIVLGSSIAAVAPAQTGAVLTAVNAAIDGLTRALARELAPLRVNAVAPSLMLSERPDPDGEAWAREALPVGWLTHPAETANAFVFLMTQPTMTGVVLRIDGGLTLA